MELWRDVLGYEGIYKISKFGILVSYKRDKERIIYGAIDNNGYAITTLRKNNKECKKRIHDIVASAFCDGKSTTSNCVNHKNGIKLDNFYKNLEWITRGENIKHAIDTGLIDNKGELSGQSKIKNEDVLLIRKMASENMSHQAISDKFGIGRRHVGDIVNRVCWKHI